MEINVQQHSFQYYFSINKRKRICNFMEVIRTYGNIIKKYAPDHPLAAFRMIKAGLALEQFRSRHLADKRLPGAYQYLNTYAVGEVLEALKHPETSVWANIFAPVELLQCFDLHSLSIECLSSFLSGFTIEDAVFLSQKFYRCHRQRHHPACCLCCHHVHHLRRKRQHLPTSVRKISCAVFSAGHSTV